MEKERYRRKVCLGGRGKSATRRGMWCGGGGVVVAVMGGGLIYVVTCRMGCRYRVCVSECEE